MIVAFTNAQHQQAIELFIKHKDNLDALVSYDVLLLTTTKDVMVVKPINVTVGAVGIVVQLSGGNVIHVIESGVSLDRLAVFTAEESATITGFDTEHSFTAVYCDANSSVEAPPDASSAESASSIDQQGSDAATVPVDAESVASKETEVTK